MDIKVGDIITAAGDKPNPSHIVSVLEVLAIDQNLFYARSVTSGRCEVVNFEGWTWRKVDPNFVAEINARREDRTQKEAGSTDG